MKIKKVIKWAALWEGGWWLWRRGERTRVYAEAAARAKELGRNLLVIGAPDHGLTGGYPCGDMTTDAEASSSCPNFQTSDITQHIDVVDNSVVVFAPCVLEYVGDLGAALAELRRIAGSEIYTVRVEPWTLTSVLYPGAVRTLPWESGRLPDDAEAQVGLAGPLQGYLPRRRLKLQVDTIKDLADDELDWTGFAAKKRSL